MIIPNTGFDVFSGFSGTLASYGGDPTIIGGISFSFSTSSAGTAKAKFTTSSGTVTRTVTNPGQIVGTASKDLLQGSRLAPAKGFWITLTGGGGDDLIYGQNGYWNVADYGTSPQGITATLTTGSVADGFGGTDALVNVVSLRGSRYADTFIGDNGGSWLLLEGMAGNDVFEGKGHASNGVSYVSSPLGVTVDLGASTASDGWGGTDTLRNVVRVFGSAFGDSIKGGAADDWFQASWGNDTVNGASGLDTLDYGMIAGPVAVVLTGSGRAGTTAKLHGTDSFGDIEVIQGGSGNDSLTGSATATQDVYLRGMAGSDVIDGAGNAHNIADYSTATGSVVFDLGAGTVTVGGTPEPDSWVGVVAVRGSAYDDDSIIGSGTGSFRIDGGGGRDVLDYRGVGAPITVVFGAGSGSGTLGGTILKPGGSDVFTGLSQFFATNGADNLAGSAGATRDNPILLAGGAGNDTIDGQGSPWVIADYRTSTSGITVTLQASGDAASWSGTASDGLGGTDTLTNVAGVYGSAHADSIRGSGQDDIVMGGAGNDTIDGGQGFDTAVYDCNSAQVTRVRHADGSWTITGPFGTDTLRNIEALQFNDGTAALPKAPGDFNGTGVSAILFENPNISWMGTSYRAVAQWTVNGKTYVDGGTVATPEASWSVASTADFNGDGRADMLWQNTGGDVSVWLMQGRQFLDGATIGHLASTTGWAIAGAADFTGDGKADLLVSEKSLGSGGAAQTTLHLWTMDGLSVTAEAAIAGVPASATVAGIADVNVDGRADILWRNTNGDVGVSLMDGATVLSSTVVSRATLDWSIIDTGDFDGDGHVDLVWQKTDGEVALWLLDGTTYRAGATIWTAGTGYKVVSVGDYDGDGQSDLLWREQPVTGVQYSALVVWLMDGLQSSGGGVIQHVANEWQVI